MEKHHHRPAPGRPGAGGGRQVHVGAVARQGAVGLLRPTGAQPALGGQRVAAEFGQSRCAPLPPSPTAETQQVECQTTQTGNRGMIGSHAVLYA